MLEVVRGLASTLKIDWQELTNAADDKRKKRGGFEQQTVLLETRRPMLDKGAHPTMSAGELDASVTLREIGVITVDEGTGTIPFARLLAKRGTKINVPF